MRAVIDGVKYRFLFALVYLLGTGLGLSACATTTPEPVTDTYSISLADMQSAEYHDAVVFRPLGVRRSPGRLQQSHLGMFGLTMDLAVSGPTADVAGLAAQAVRGAIRWRIRKVMTVCREDGFDAGVIQLEEYEPARGLRVQPKRIEAFIVSNSGHRTTIVIPCRLNFIHPPPGMVHVRLNTQSIQNLVAERGIQDMPVDVDNAWHTFHVRSLDLIWPADERP